MRLAPGTAGDAAAGPAPRAPIAAAEAPVLPARAVLSVDGRVGRLDLPACLALWRQAAGDAALPDLDAHVSAAQLLAGTHAYAGVRVAASASRLGGELRVEAPGLALATSWPAAIDRDHPATVHLASFNIAQPEDVALSAALATALAPAAQLAIDDLSVAGPRARQPDRPAGRAGRRCWRQTRCSSAATLCG